MEQTQLNISPNSNNPPKENQPTQNSKKQPIDVIASYQKGNFGPAIVCLKNKWLQPDLFDDNGYNILHNATCYNDQSVVRLLVEYFEISPDLRAKNGQTNVMIAANFGYLEILKYFIDKNVDIEAQDNANFTALLYSCKSNYATCFFYLLSKGSQLTIVDQNGCGVAHWAAYRDNIFFLRIFKTLGLDLNVKDYNGFTPFQRAIQNESYDSIEFFCEEAGVDLLPESLEMNKIESPYIKNYLSKKLQEKRNEIPLFDYEQRFWKFYMKRPRFYITIFYVISILSVYYNFLTGIYQMAVNERGVYFWTDILFNLLTFYLLIFCMMFIWCFKSAQQKVMKQQTKKYQKLEEDNSSNNNNNNSNSLEFSQNDDILQGFTNVNLEEMKYLNFQHLDNLLKNIVKKDNSLLVENELLSTSEKQSYTFLHYLAYLIETHQFITAQSIDYQRYCPTCFTYKQPKTKHCKICKTCIPNFNHHSFIFNKCINNQNHLAYLTLLIIQEIWLILSLYLQISTLNNKRTSWNLLFFIEIAYINLTLFSLLNCILYVISGIACFYNTLFLILELSGICLNQTYNEIFNRTRYRYLYEPYIDKKGKVWNRYVNKTSLGILRNIKMYFRRMWSF